MRFQCNHCRALLELEDVEPGVQCPTCLSPVAVPDSVTAPRALLGDFVIKSLIGNGGMGIVYLAHQVTLDRDVALKVLHADFSSDTVFIQNFINEARAAASLNHPNIVQAVAVNCDEGRWYFAMEYVNGNTLRQLLDQNGRIPAKQMLDIAKEIVSALRYAWNEKHIVHRDIKPDNIMLTTEGHAKLADLGLARKITELHEDGSTELYGTPQYLAPELLLGAAPNAASDIYSLGATLYHAISGRFPFVADTPEAIANLHLSAPLTPLKDVAPDIPEQLSRLVDIMMAKSPSDRYQDYDELEHDLERVAKGEMPLHAPSAETATADSAHATEAIVGKHGKAKLKFTKTHAKLHKTEKTETAPALLSATAPSTATDTSESQKKNTTPSALAAAPVKTGMVLPLLLGALALILVAASIGAFFIIRARRSAPTQTVSATPLPAADAVEQASQDDSQQQDTQQLKTDAEAKAQEEKARQETEEKARLAEEAKAAEEQAKLEAEEKARQEAEEKARKEAEEKARLEAEEKARKEAEEKARQEAEEKARKEAVAAEKTKRLETAISEVAARDYSGARQVFFSHIENEEPADQEWRNQWEQALTLAENFWDGLKDAAPKLIGTQLNEFSMKSMRQKYSKNNFTDSPWTIVDMTGDIITLQREYENTSANDVKEMKTVQWTRKLQELRSDQIEALAQTIGALPGKALDESEQACGLYLLISGTAPAKSIIEKYKLDVTWPSIASSADSLSPKAFISMQLACIRERADTAANAKEPLIRILSSIQAYSLGNALYMTFPSHKELYASEVQQIVKPLFIQKK